MMSSNLEMIITIFAVLIFSYFIPQGSCCQALEKSIGNMTPDYDIFVGKELVINCNLYKPIINTNDGAFHVNSSSLAFKFKGENLTENIWIIDDLTIQLRIPNASAENSGQYFCFLNVPKGKRKVVCNGEYSVGYAPLSVKNFSCISLHLQALQCSWTPPANLVHTKYILSDDIYDSNKCHHPRNPIFTRKCPGPIPNGDEKNSCQWTRETVAPYKVSNAKLCFSLKGMNSLGDSEQLISVDHYSIVIAGKPKSILIQNLTSNSFMAVWLPPKDMDTIETFPPGLTYELHYKPINSNSWQVTTVGNGVRVNITNLIPYTNYNIQLRCRSNDATSDEMWSENVTTSVITYPDIPYLAPETTAGLFETRHLEGRRNITLYWKRVPQQFWNSEDFKYIITYGQTYIGKGKRALDQTRTYISHEKSSAVFADLDVNAAYEFILSSINKEGQSFNFSTIKVQKKEEMLSTPRNIKVIFNEIGHYNLSWDIPHHSSKDRHIDSYTIFWCKMVQPSLFPCKGPLNWKSVPATERTMSLSLPNEDAYFKFAVSANTKYSSSGLEWAPCVIPLNGGKAMCSISLDDLEKCLIRKLLDNNQYLMP